MRALLFALALSISCLGFSQDTGDSATSAKALDLYNNGTDKFVEGNSLGAIKDFTEALSLDSTFAEAYLGRGSVNAQIGEFSDALEDIGKAIKYDPSMSEAFFNRAYVYMALNDQENALNDLNMYVLKQPKDINGYLARLDILVQNGMHKEAYGDFEKITSLTASTPQELLQRGRVKHLKNDTLGAIKDLDTAISKMPNFMDAYYLRGKYYYQLANYDMAVQDLNIFILAESNDASAYALRGDCFAKQEEFSLANNDFSKAIKLDASNPQYYFDRGFFNLQLEEWQQAQIDFKKAIYYNHKDPKLAFFNLGIADYKLDNKTEACKNWKRSGSLGEDYLSKYCLE